MRTIWDYGLCTWSGSRCLVCAGSELGKQDGRENMQARFGLKTEVSGAANQFRLVTGSGSRDKTLLGGSRNFGLGLTSLTRKDFALWSSFGTSPPSGRSAFLSVNCLYGCSPLFPCSRTDLLCDSLLLYWLNL